jgi:phenylalanyl-tRNA synthetase beta chain
MRVPISWLREFVDIPIPVEELAQRLALFGLEVDKIERIGVEGADLPWDPDKVLIGNILEVRQHPNADRLVLADVDYGAEQPHTVVTGAPNLFEYRGKGRLSHPLKSVFAKEGAQLYDGHAEGQVKVTLKGRPVRGVMSDAMLCSEKELGLSDDHEGILILPDDAPTGMPLRDYLGDVVLDIDVLPNMSRALSILGVAREVSALLGVPLRMPEMNVEANGPSIEGRVSVTIETPELCPRFSVTLIEGVKIGPSPFWMQRRLLLAGMRPINNIVDVTNYVMLELGEPSHAFDADKVADQHLIVRLARPGEQLVTLDGQKHELTAERLLVCDPKGPLSIAGVMGGEASEVSATTTRVLLEAAIWEPATIRRTAQALRLTSEASRRYERGVDYELPPLMQRRALSLMQQLTGGTVAQGIVDAYVRPWQTVVLDLTTQHIKRLIGISLSVDEIQGYLTPLGFECEKRDEQTLRVTVPSYRRDVSVVADLCEEVARMYGYDRLPSTLLADELPEQNNNAIFELEQKVRTLLTGSGLDEAITYSMTSMASVAKISPADADPNLYLKLANPLTPEREYMRRSLLPTLLEAVVHNLRELDRVLLFEIGRVYLRRDDALLPDEPRRLAIAITGPREAQSWLASKPEPLDFFDLKGIVESVLLRLNIRNKIGFTPVRDDPRLHPGRAARLEVRDPRTGAVSGQVGVLGELHPQVRENLEIEDNRVLVAELDLEALLALSEPLRYQPISRFPATTQDLALIVPLDEPADKIATLIRKYAGNMLESLTLFDVYTGPQVGQGKRSLAYRLVFRAPDRTLTDNDVNKIRVKIIRGLEREAGATIRA